jgi:sulfur-oxidizing protein SoxZ
METGYRRDGRGLAVPRHIISRLVVTYNGVEIFRVDLFPGVSANPYFAFTTTAVESGEIQFDWTDDRGETTTERRAITVA